MRLTSKCLVVALSALFAATPAVPAAAMPLPVVKVQPVEAGTGAQLVDHRWGYRRHWRGGHRWGRYEGRRWYPRGRYDDWRGGRYGYYHGYRHRHRSDAWVPLAILGMGAIVGSAIANERRGYVGGGSHVNWCANRYRSYRAYDNTFQPYNGPRRPCYSPYR
ncbi:MAG: BA14K family protein [Shinella sp.]|uniref:BA14K family protein n=1 Tax=Shinella sp. TaxID=1870904 RepID=UPI003C7672B9